MRGMLAISGLALALAGCGTPGELKRAPPTPTMVRPMVANPLPPYAAPDPQPRDPRSGDLAAPS